MDPLCFLALCYDQLGRYEEAIPLYQELLPLARAAGDREKEKIVLMGMAGALTQLGRYHDALPHWQAALRFAREMGDRDTLAETLASNGYALMQADQPEQALPLLYEALEFIRAAENRESEANTLNTLGVALSKLGRTQEAMEVYEQALTLAREAGNRGEQAFHLGNIGHEYADHLGQPERAVVYFKQALALFREVGDSAQEALTLYNLGKAYQLCGGHLREAERFLKKGRRLAGELGNVELGMLILEALSAVLAEQGRLEDAVAFTLEGRAMEDPRHALERHREEREHVRARGDRRAEAYHLGEVATALGVLDYRADALCANLEACALFRQLGDRHGEGICFVNIGTHCYFLAQYPECLACWSHALVLLQGENSADEELLMRKLEQVEQQVGRRAFGRYKHASVPFLQQIEAQVSDLEALFSPILLLAREKDQDRQQVRVVFEDLGLQQRFLRLMDDPADFVFTGEAAEDASWYEQE